MTALPTKEMLPPNLARIARVIGVDAALRLAAAEGGRFCTFPEADQVGEDHWLAALIGLRSARKLCDALADEDGEIVSLRIERADGAKAEDDWFEPLPPFLSRIAGLVGNDAALKVMQERGGERIYLPTPERLHGEHWLAKLIGYPAALQLVREFGHGPQDIPAGLKTEMTSRRKPGAHPLDEFLLAGFSISQSALRAGFDRSTARRRRVYLRGQGVLQ